MAVLCGWASIDENGKARGGKAGDQKQVSNTNDTKGEVKLGNWYNFGQGSCWRWKDRKLAERFAQAVKDICNNKHVGYDQNERASLFNVLEAANWDWTKINKDVECDCSELIACCVNCAVGKKVISSWVYTGNLDAALKTSGYFEEMTGTKYTAQSDYLGKGDVLNAKSHHVIAVLENGPKFGVTSTSEGKSNVAEPTLKKGSTGSQVKKLQKNLNTLKFTDENGKALEVDGDFGTHTREAVKKYQRKYKLEVDGVYGPKSYEKMKTLIK